MAGNNLNLDPEVIRAATDSVMDALIKTGAIKIPKPARKRMNWERLLMYEYVEKFYQNIPHWYRVEVGPIPGGKNEMLYSRLRRWADCVIHFPDHMLLIEGKMKGNIEVVAQLQNYKLLVPQTPLFEKYKDLPVKMLLVCAMIDDGTREFVENNGIEVVVYKPANFEEWYKWIVQKGETG